MTTPPAIVCRDLTRVFGRRLVLDGLDLTIPVGQVVGLVGANGAGKTTFLRLLLGLLAPSRGSVQVLGRPADDPSAAHRGRIAFLAEDHPVHAWRTVAGLGAWHRAFHPRFDAGVYAALTARAGLAPRARLGSLSRGQRASACLAATVASDPDLMLLDDPALGLDANARHDLLEAILATVRRPERTVLISSHQVADLERVADRLVILHQGRLCADAPVEVLRERVRAWHYVFAGPPPADPPIPGRCTWTVLGQDADLMAVVPDPATPPPDLGAQTVTPLPLSLDAICTALTGIPRPTFQATLDAARGPVGV